MPPPHLKLSQVILRYSPRPATSRRTTSAHPDARPHHQRLSSPKQVGIGKVPSFRQAPQPAPQASTPAPTPLTVWGTVEAQSNGFPRLRHPLLEHRHSSTCSHWWKFGSVCVTLLRYTRLAVKLRAIWGENTGKQQGSLWCARTALERDGAIGIQERVKIRSWC
jgi:hypothetical protein